MHAAPQLTDLGSFQGLTLSSTQASTGGVMGAAASLVSDTKVTITPRSLAR